MAEELRLLGEYTTRRAHVGYPAGSKCTAYRSRSCTLLLRMEDGVELELGPDWFCEGLESPRTWGGPAADIMRQLDEQALADIDRALLLHEKHIEGDRHE